MNSQRGFSLIEALIALVVLSIGLIGVAAMQLKALQSATAGYQRSVATLAAVDAQERLWAELAEIRDTDSDNRVDCSGINGSDIEGDWRSDWFEGSQTPIRHFSGAVIDGSNCEFLIEINLEQNPGDIDPETFTYTFRLPDLP